MSKTPRTSGRRRALGQHFLSNRKAAERIVAEFAPRPGETILEIGPGQGVLTGLLLEAGARVIAVEIDPDLAARVAAKHEGEPRLTIHRADILDCDLEAIVGGGPARVLANLPYAITGAILVRLFGAAGALTGMTLMLQREVVERILAPPGNRTYGSLSVLAQYFTRPKMRMKLAPGSFTPPPAVESAVIHMPFRAARELTREQEVGYPPFVRALFAHRRQTLANNLKAAAFTEGVPADQIAGRLVAAGIDPRRRPETLSREECLAVRAAFLGRS